MLHKELQHAQSQCHPERLKKIADFRRESKDLRTDLTANVPSVRRSFDSLRSLRMTDFGGIAKTAFCNRSQLSFSAEIRVQISFSNTVGVDVDIHAGFAVLLVNLFKAAQKFGAVIFLEAVGT